MNKKVRKNGGMSALLLLVIIGIIVVNQTNVYAKNKNDVKALRQIIRVQRKQGADVSKNINDKNEYRWEKGRLVEINWDWSYIKGNLNLNKFTKLQIVEIGNNKIKNLYINKCKKMKYLDCQSNKIKKLNISKLRKLKYLYCSENKLKRIKICSLNNLKVFNCNRNKISKINLSNNKRLTHLDCSFNKLKKLNLSNNSEIVSLWCGFNKLETLNLRNCELNVGLECSSNRLKSIILRENMELEYLLIDDNFLVSLPFDRIHVDILFCSGNEIKEIDMKKFTNYPTFIWCDQKVKIHGWNEDKYAYVKEKGSNKTVEYHINLKKE